MKSFEIVRYQIPLRKKKKQIPTRIRLVLLTDLHGRQYGPENELLLNAIDELKPDLIVSAGDMIVSDPKKPVEISTAVRLLTRLAKTYPVMTANGNHEYRTKIYPELFEGVYDRLKAAYDKAGICLLENENRTVVIKGEKLVLYGFELDARFYKRHTREKLLVKEIESLLQRPQKDGMCIMLAHNPAFFEAYAAWGADLVLSGHVHGGMIRLPLLGGVVSPQVRLFPKYDRGLFHIGRKRMIVSGGLGSHTIPIRIFNPTQLVVIDLI